MPLIVDTVVDMVIGTIREVAALISLDDVPRSQTALLQLCRFGRIG